MAARKSTAKKKAEPKLDEAAKAAKAAEEIPDGFMVVKQRDEEGNLNVAFFPVGKCEVTEAVTLLGMAYQAARRQVGLE